VPVRFEKISDNCLFIFIPELESVWAAISLLSGEKLHTLCTEIYGAERVAVWKRRYSFLFETYQILAEYFSANMLDYLLDIPAENISLESLQSIVREQKPEDFVWRQFEFQHFNKNASKEILRKAITDDSALDEAYSWIAEHCSSFLAFSAFVRQSERFIDQFFSLAAEMRTPEFVRLIDKQLPRVEMLYQRICSGAQSGDLLALSEELMGKTFKNRGPYSEFIFMPSYFMPMKACRFFEVEGEPLRQILFLTLHKTSRDSEDRVRALKAIADPTRYQILTLLAQEGPMRGLDIAQKVSIATSTVSHHMEQMKESGLITEEPVKNSKYYGLSKQSAKALLDEIADDLGIK